MLAVLVAHACQGLDLPAQGPCLYCPHGPCFACPREKEKHFYMRQGDPQRHLNISARCTAELARSNYAKPYEVSKVEYWEDIAWRIWNKFLKPNLPVATPTRIVDVGCGFGLYNIHVSRHYGGKTQIVYFDQPHVGPNARDVTKGRINKASLQGFHKSIKTFSFYENDPSCTREMAASNGVPSDKIEILAATEDNLRGLRGSVDLIYSHMSWGYHYAVATYISAAFEALSPGGNLMLLVRDPQAKAQAEAVGFACEMKQAVQLLEEVADNPSWQVMKCSKAKPYAAAAGAGHLDYSKPGGAAAFAAAFAAKRKPKAAA